MEYSPSTELVSILLENGFQDITNKTYPDHYEYIQQYGYDPGLSKRVLQYNRGRDCIKFDYITITPCFQGAALESKYSLNEDELKSLITFFKLPYHARVAVIGKGLSIFRLHEEYGEIKQYPQYYKGTESKRLVEFFEGIRL